MNTKWMTTLILSFVIAVLVYNVQTIRANQPVNNSSAVIQGNQPAAKPNSNAGGQASAQAASERGRGSQPSAEVPPFVVVVAIDSSKSLVPFAPLVRAETEKIARSVPSGVPFSIIEFDREVRPISRGGGGPDTKLNLGTEKLTFKGEGSDIGSALLAAVNEASTLNDEVAAFIIIMTDGQPRPVRASPFAGQGLDVILDNPRIAGEPSKRHLAIRVLGPGLITAARSNVVVLTSEPDWTVMFARFEASKRPKPLPTPEQEKLVDTSSSQTPVILLTLLVVTAVITVGSRVFARRLKSRRQDEAEAMLRPVIVDGPPPEPMPVRRFLITAQGGEEAILEPQSPSISIGTQFNDDLMISAAEASARVTLEELADGRVRIGVENTGLVRLFIGALEVKPGGRKWLPGVQPVEMNVGGDVVMVKEIINEEVGDLR